MNPDELVDQCFYALMNDRKLGMPLSAHFERHILKQRIAAIIPIVRAYQSEEDAKIAERHETCECSDWGSGNDSAVQNIASAIRDAACRTIEAMKQREQES